MATISLSTTDTNRLGEYASDGTIEKWPELDVMGKPYIQVNATIHNLNSSLFVVISPDGYRVIDEITFTGSPVTKAAPRRSDPTEPNG